MKPIPNPIHLSVLRGPNWLTGSSFLLGPFQQPISKVLQFSGTAKV